MTLVFIGKELLVKEKRTNGLLPSASKVINNDTSVFLEAVPWAKKKPLAKTGVVPSSPFFVVFCLGMGVIIADCVFAFFFLCKLNNK